jgi:hypothetical protein
MVLLSKDQWQQLILQSSYNLSNTNFNHINHTIIITVTRPTLKLFPNLFNISQYAYTRTYNLQLISYVSTFSHVYTHGQCSFIYVKVQLINLKS